MSPEIIETLQKGTAILIFIILLLAVMMKGFKKGKLEKDNLLWWETKCSFDLTDDQMEHIRKRCEMYERDGYQVDSITWSDLELDVIYRRLNNCLSDAGDVMLYDMLKHPALSEKELDTRTAFITWASENPGERELVKFELAKLGRSFRVDLETFLEKENANKTRLMISYVLSLIMLGSIILTFVKPMIFIPVVLVFFVINSGVSWYYHSEMKNDVDVLVHVLNYASTIHTLNRKNLELPYFWNDRISDLSEKVEKMQKTAFLREFDNISPFHMLISQLFMVEAIMFERKISLVQEHKQYVSEMIECIGKMDACIAIASIIHQNNYEKNVTLKETGKPFIQATDMVHPYLENPVSNNVDFKTNVLVTGSNATGKSSYLKMVGINAIIAQSFGFAFAKSYEASFFKVFSSMALRDDIVGNDSYFVKEIKSLKRILDEVDENIPVLCILDEILRGTNTMERISASSQILASFAQKNLICFVATHDIELTRILKGLYTNVHFTETMKDGKMTFDYKLKQGPSRSRNAIALLEMLGYGKSVMERANNRLETFESVNHW